jgi:hypothetical protein
VSQFGTLTGFVLSHRVIAFNQASGPLSFIEIARISETNNFKMGKHFAKIIAAAEKKLV